MSETILIGQGLQITEFPRDEWEQGLSGIAPIVEAELEFMSEEHHRVRNFVVKELPHAGQPLSPELIARELDLTIDRIKAILDELETHLMFLFRNEQGAVNWAYPVTVDRTPHHLTFSTGELLHAA